MIVESRIGPDGVRALDLFIAKAGIELALPPAAARQLPAA